MTNTTTTLSIDEAIVKLRSMPEHRQLISDSYLSENTQEAADAFTNSGEFAEVLRMLGGVKGKVVLDMGAGCGIATYAFCLNGASCVISLEPDGSDLVGRGALARLTEGMPREIVDAFGEALPMADESIDVVYCRQVLHHTRDLKKVMRECYRVLKPGGQILACREHIVDNATQLAEFLANHLVHQLAGGEHAFSLETYQTAMRSAGFQRLKSLSEYASVISAFPRVRQQSEIESELKQRLQRKLGPLGRLAGHLPGVREAVIRRASRNGYAGRMYTFHAWKTK